MEYIVTLKHIENYKQHLQMEARSRGTIQKYLRDTRAFYAWLDGERVTMERISDWRNYLLSKGYQPSTINSMLASLNGLFKMLKWEGIRATFVKIQRRMFREADRELTREEYHRLVRTAQERGEKRLALLLETICATGIRVSEVKYITVEAAKRGRAEIVLEGKIRTILFPQKLARKLLKYANRDNRNTGEIFLTSKGKTVSRRQIWAEMKRLCVEANVKPSKVFPHNLRHLFATTYYQSYKDIVHLADVLGHSSIETTRIYLLTSGEEHLQQLERLQLVS